MKTRTIVISIGVALLLVGCGSNSNSNSNNKISVPTKIDMEMPKALQTNSSKKTERLHKEAEPIAVPIDAPMDDPMDTEPNDFDRQPNKSQGYYQLKDDIENAEMMQRDLQVNLLLADKIMPQIQEKCDNTPLGETCNIEANQLSFVLDEAMRKDIVKVTREEFSEDYINSKGATEADKTFTLGAVSFTQYNSSADYQYALKMDMSSFDNAYGENSSSLQTIKWSKDENRVWSIRHYGSNNSNSTISIRYLKKANGETQMEIDDEYESTVTPSMASISIPAPTDENVPKEESLPLVDDTPTTEQMKGEFHFKISNLNDYFKINANSKDFMNDQEMGIMNSIGEISDTGGYLSFVGNFMDEEYREKNTFDANGDIIFSGYCSRSESCDMNDESTWLSYDEGYGDNDVEVFENTNMTALNVTGGDLKEGQYLLLSPNTTIDNLSTEEVFDAMIGDIYVSKDVKFGSLNSKEYMEVLDTLVMVYVDFVIDEQDPLKEPTFELVTAENRPTLSLQE